MAEGKKQVFNVSGMTCSACSNHVEKSVRALKGITDVRVNLMANNMVVEYESSVTPDEIISAVETAGYGASLPETDNKKAKAPEDESEKMKKRFVFSLIFLLPLMYLSMGHMLKLPGVNLFFKDTMLSAYAVTQLLLTTPVIFINFKFFSGGFKALIKGSPNMDTLVATGSAASLIYGIYSLYGICYFSAQGNFEQAHKLVGNLYFESAAMIPVLITAGKFLEAKAKKRTSDAVNALLKIVPTKAQVLRNGKEISISAEELAVGDYVVVRRGESFPCDGVVKEGEGTADESAVTGESIPVVKKAGDKVTGATILSSGYVVFEAELVGKDTLFAKIIDRVREASGTKAPIARFADKVCAVFVPTVMAVSVVTFVLWLVCGGSVETAFRYSVSVLVISCPCALGLATPTAIMAGTGRGAQMGILFKNAEVLETLHGAEVLVTDKTGTLTYGTPEVTDIVPAEGDEEALLRLAASVESKSEHPLAKAILKKAEGLVLHEVTSFEQVDGGGIKGVVESKAVIAGNEKLLKNNGIEFVPSEKFSGEGKTVLYFAVDGKYKGAVAVRDLPREDSAETVKQLNKNGVEVVMLTGDNKITARAIACETGITKVVAEVKPQDKENVVSEIMKDGKTVVMVGDGINDAPALAKADVGIAVGGGTDAAMESADVVLISGKFSDCAAAIDLSRAVMRNIKQNLFWAFFYNVLGIPLAAGVFAPVWGISLTPMIASFSMSCSSLIVVSNALRLRYFKKVKNKNKKTEENKMTKTLKINGMMCHHCTGRVEKALNEIDGVSAVVNLDDGGKAIITLSKDVPEELLVKTVTDEGYQVVSVE